MVSLAQVEAFEYPKITENPKEKTPKYIAQYGKAFFSDYMRKPELANWYHGRERYAENSSYSLGEQNLERYHGHFNKKDDGGRRPWERLRLKELKLLPRYFRIMQSKLSEVKFDAICTPIDSMARQEKEEYAAKLRFAMEYQQWMAGMGIDPSTAAPEGEPDIPIDEDEYQQRMDTFQNQAAVDMEIKIAITLNENNWEQLDREFDADTRDYGVCAFEDYTYNGRHYIKRIDPALAFIPYSEYEDHRDIVHAGYLQYLTVAELREQLSAEYTEPRELDRIIASIPNKRQYNNESKLGIVGDSSKVEVFYFQFKSKDQYVAKKSKSGIVRERPFTYAPERLESGAEVRRIPYNSVYEGRLILGTDYSYGCRKVYNQKRDMQNPADCLLNIHAFAPGMRKGRVVPLNEEVQAVIDAIYKDWIGMHDDIARAVPEAWAFDHDALDQVVLQSGGKVESKAKLIDIFKGTGEFHFRGTKIDKETPIGKPIQHLPGGGIPPSVMTRINLIQSNIALIEQITGINNITAGTNPNPEMGARTSEMAVEGSLSSLESLFWCKNKRFEALVKSIGIRVRSGEKYRPVVGDVVLSNGQRVSAQPSENLEKHTYDMRVENRTSEREWEEFYIDARKALDNKEITIADMAQIRIARNLKQGYYMLAARVRRNERTRKAEAMQMQEQNGQIQQQSAQMAEQAKQATLQMKAEIDAIARQENHANAMALQAARLQGEYGIAELQVRGQVEGKRILGDNDIKTATVKGEVDVVKVETQAALAPKKEEAPV